MASEFQLAVVQMRVKPGALEQNLCHAKELVAAAALDEARVVLLPEAMDAGWTDDSARDLADRIPDGKTAVALQEMARANGVFICSGLTERDGASIYNAAVLIDPSGTILLKHRKINELAIAHSLYGSGSGLAVADTSLGRIGVMICADAFIRGQTISRGLASMGAQIILSPCAWAVPAEHDNHAEPYGNLWRDNYSPVARDFGITIAGASNVGPVRSGPWAGRKCIGCSLVVGPAGAALVQGPYGENAETILHVNVPLGPVRRPCGEPGL